MWNCWECSKCYRCSKNNNVWGDACDDAKTQGFRNISIQYCLDSDPNRPKHWEGSFTPGLISVFSTLCDLCQDMTIEEYFRHLKVIVLQHDYRYHGGAGGTNNLTFIPMRDIVYSYYNCAVCQKEIFIDCLKEEMHEKYDYIEISSGNGHLCFCPSCRTKTKVKKLDSLTEEWKNISNKRWNEAFPGSRHG
jgi:hypothetical protein